MNDKMLKTLRTYHDEVNKFYELFNKNTGMYVRSGILDENKKDTGVDPFMRKMPSLIDIGVMGRCIHGESGLCIKSGIECYQNGLNIKKKNMSPENFKKIIEQTKNHIFQCLRDTEVVLYKPHVQSIPSIVKLKDVNTGGYVYNGNEFCKILDINKKTVDSFIRIKTNGGRVLDCTSEHKFPINKIENIIQAKDIQIGDKLFYNESINKNNDLKYIDLIKIIIDENLDDEFFINNVETLCTTHNIKMTQNKTVKLSKIKHLLSFEDYKNSKINKERCKEKLNAILPINNELLMHLGHYVGNGSKRTYTMDTNKEKMCKQIELSLKNNFSEYKYSKTINGNLIKIELDSKFLNKTLFDDLLKCRDIDKEKQLPNFIMLLSYEQKIKFLRGYFCDGNISKQKSDGNYGEIVFNTSSNKLYKDLTILFNSMNIDFCINTEKANSSIFSKNEKRNISRKRRFRIRISNKIDINKILESVEDHKDYIEFKNLTKINNINYTLGSITDKRIIKSIEVINKKIDVVDINIESKDKLFMTTNGIITHNCALGGRGDVNKHESFQELLEICTNNGIVPNYTTSGLDLTQQEVEITKKHCGAVAVSEYRSKYTRNAIKMLLNADIKTNIHFVLGNNTIDEAIHKLKTNGFDKGINAVIFLLHKPVGLGSENHVLNVHNPKVKVFFELINSNKFDFKVGFDSCSCSGIVNLATKVNTQSIDFCEGARHSCYIDADMNMMPCSFGNQDSKWFVDLNNYTIEEAWNSEVFEKFRKSLLNSCPDCSKRDNCGGGCPIVNQITLCDNKERSFYNEN